MTNKFINLQDVINDFAKKLNFSKLAHSNVSFAKTNKAISWIFLKHFCQAVKIKLCVCLALSNREKKEEKLDSELWKVFFL